MSRQCLTDGCVEPAVPDRSRCQFHGGRAWARRQANRQAMYADPQYRANRLIVLDREPLCHWQLPGCTRISTQADHLVSLAEGGTNDLSNLAGACGPCNEKRGGALGREQQRRRKP